MSAFRYNGVSLLWVKTLAFDVDDEKDPSGADQLWRKYTVTVRGVVSNGSTVTNGPLSFATLQEALTTPRKPLFYQMGGQTVFDTSGLDARYGPDAPKVHLDQIVEGVIFAEVTVVLRVACAGNPATGEVVSCRWQQSEEIDSGEWLTTLVTRGVLITRTDLRKLTADSFRESIPVPLPYLNFVRRYSFTLSEDGTRLSFEFRDSEKYTMPPNLAVEASGTFAVTAPKPGAIRFAAVNLTLKGPPGVPRALLMAQAFGVAWAKLKSANLATATQDKYGRVIVGYTATEDMYRNIVQVSMQATMATVDMDFLGTANKKLYGTTPGSDDTLPRSFSPPLRRQIGGLLSAAFRDPCLASLTQLDTAPNSGQPGAANNPSVTIRQGTVSGTLPDGVAPGYKADRGGYEVYRVESTYDWDEGKAGLPGTGVGSTPKKAKVVKVHGGRMQLLIDWVVRRRGLPPVIPSYQINDPNLEPMRAIYRPLQGEVSADQSPLWDIAGRFVYLVLDPDAAAVTSPRPPYLSELAAQQSSLSTKYTADDVFAGISASGGSGNTDTVPPAGSSGTTTTTGPNPITGSGVAANQQPTPDLTSQLTAAQQAYIDQVVALGGDRSVVTQQVQQGLVGPLDAPGQPPVNP